MADDSLLDRTRLERAIVARYHVRLHLSLILAACFAASLVVTKLLLMAGLGSMLIRYPVAVLVAYGTFLLGIRLWLSYAGYSGGSSPPSGARQSKSSGVDLIDGFSSGGGSSSGSGGGGPSFRGGGGNFGGGGASAEFADTSIASGETRASTSGWFSGSVLRDTWIPFVAVLALTLVFAVVAHHYHPDAHTLREIIRML